MSKPDWRCPDCYFEFEEDEESKPTGIESVKKLSESSARGDIKKTLESVFGSLLLTSGIIAICIYLISGKPIPIWIYLGTGYAIFNIIRINRRSRQKKINVKNMSTEELIEKMFNIPLCDQNF